MVMVNLYGKSKKDIAIRSNSTAISAVENASSLG
jgi:hypothetical protein